MFDSNIVIYKSVQDLHFFITGGDDENELILANVLQGLFDAIALLLRFLLFLLVSSLFERLQFYGNFDLQWLISCFEGTPLIKGKHLRT